MYTQTYRPTTHTCTDTTTQTYAHTYTDIQRYMKAEKFLFRANLMLSLRWLFKPTEDSHVPLDAEML